MTPSVGRSPAGAHPPIVGSGDKAHGAAGEVADAFGSAPYRTTPREVPRRCHGVEPRRGRERRHRPARSAAVQSPVVVDGPAVGLIPFVPLEGDAPSSTVDSGGAPLGAIRMVAGSYTPGATPAPAGQVLSAAAYPNASAAFGSAFGGDGSTTFGVPDLRGRTPIGVGTRSGGSTVALGDKVGSESRHDRSGRDAVAYGGDGSSLARRPPGLGLTYLVRTSGRNASASYVAFDSLGVVVPYAGTVVPAGWTPADGRLLSIAGNPDLFAVLGTTYGGDGATTFALPDHAVVRRSKPTATSTAAARSARSSVRSRWPSRRPTFPTRWAAIG